LFTQTGEDAKKARSPEERDKEIYTRLQREAMKGNVTAMRYVGRLTNDGRGVPKNEAKAREWFEKAAAVGDAAAMGELGSSYFWDEGGNGEKARECFEKGAVAGDATAMFWLSIFAGEADNKESDQWLEKAAAAGHVDSMMDLGARYLDG